MRRPLKEGREIVCKSVSLSVPMFHAQRVRLQIESRRRRRLGRRLSCETIDLDQIDISRACVVTRILIET